MEKAAPILVRKRNMIFRIMALITVVCAVAMSHVRINTDMTRYLPDDSSMHRGIVILSGEMSSLSMTNSVRVMFDTLKEDPQEVRARLGELAGVESVDYRAGDPHYESGSHILFVLNCSCGFNSPEMKEILQSLEADFSPLCDKLSYALDDTSGGEIPLWIVAIAVILIVVILVTMSSSWVESFLYLLVIGAAILINLGTNLIMGSISDITFSIAALLQLVLSMDYSIILMSRYRQELKLETDPEKAMASALTKAFSSIAGSAFTTVVGLLAMLFMQFKIGADLGIVLAKGVFISMVCILTMLPALILFFHNLIIKTNKKSLSFSFDTLGAFEERLRFPILAVFVLFFAAMFLLKGNTDISFTMTEPSEVDAVFKKSNPIILLYENGDEDAVSSVAGKLEGEEGVESVLSYGTTLGKRYTPQSLAVDLPALLRSDLLSGQSGLSLPAEIDKLSEEELSEMASSLLPLLYYEAAGYHDDNSRLSLKELLTFFREDILSGSWAQKLIPEEINAAFSAFTILANGKTGRESLTSDQMYETIAKNIPKASPQAISILYDLYFSRSEGRDYSEMTLLEIIDYLGGSLAEDPRWTALLPAGAADVLSSLRDAALEGASQLKGPDHSLMMINTYLDDESPETEAFMNRLQETLSRTLSGEYYLLGNTPMAYEMSASFSDELTKMTLITAFSIFLVVLITFRSVLIPLVLVLMIQSAVYATMVIINLQGYSIYYLALLMVQCILMGATIDYAILYANYYREYRMTMTRKEALTASYRGSMHTVMTSGLIIASITWILGHAFPNPTIGEICFTISKGATCSLVMIIFLLPGILAALDRFVTGKNLSPSRKDGSGSGS